MSNYSPAHTATATLPSATTTLHVLVGTTGDNALHAAQAAADTLASHFKDTTVTRLDSSHGIAVLASETAAPGAPQTSDTVYIVCSSTHGAGDVPENAQAFLASLDLEPAYLGHVYYGLMAMGDSTYGDTYAGGPKLLDAKLADLGAKRIGMVFEHDASEDDDAPAAARAWATDWIASWAKP
jgi:MioC protein